MGSDIKVDKCVNNEADFVEVNLSLVKIIPKICINLIISATNSLAGKRKLEMSFLYRTSYLVKVQYVKFPIT